MCDIYICVGVDVDCGVVDNFIPESVDATKPGTIEAKRWQEGTRVTVERALVAGSQVRIRMQGL